MDKEEDFRKDVISYLDSKVKKLKIQSSTLKGNEKKEFNKQIKEVEEDLDIEKRNYHTKIPSQNIYYIDGFGLFFRTEYIEPENNREDRKFQQKALNIYKTLSFNEKGMTGYEIEKFLWNSAANRFLACKGYVMRGLDFLTNDKSRFLDRMAKKHRKTLNHRKPESAVLPWTKPDNTLIEKRYVFVYRNQGIFERVQREFREILKTANRNFGNVSQLNDKEIISDENIFSKDSRIELKALFTPECSLKNVCDISRIEEKTADMPAYSFKFISPNSKKLEIKYVDLNSASRTYESIDIENAKEMIEKYGDSVIKARNDLRNEYAAKIKRLQDKAATDREFKRIGEYGR